VSLDVVSGRKGRKNVVLYIYIRVYIYLLTYSMEQSPS
jgi:hypothetical protein